MSSCSPQKIACGVESIGVFVADICVVALRKDLSHNDTSIIEFQSPDESSKEWSSLFRVAKESIAAQ